MADYQALHDDFRTNGSDVAAISVDEPARADSMKRELGIDFEILCDTNRDIITRYGLLNSGEKGGIAYPCAMVIDRERVIRFLAREEVHNRVEPADVLRFVSALNKGVKPPENLRPKGVWPGAMFLRATMNAFRHGVNVRWRA